MNQADTAATAADPIALGSYATAVKILSAHASLAQFAQIMKSILRIRIYTTTKIWSFKDDLRNI